MERIGKRDPNVIFRRTRLPIVLYRDGIDLWRWRLQFRARWLRGLALGIEWHPGRGSDASLTHSRVEVRILVVVVVVEHVGTYVVPVHRLPRRGEWKAP